MTDRTETDEILDGYLTADFDPLQAFVFDDDTDADDEAPSVLAEGPFNMPNPEAAPQFQRDLVAFDNGETAVIEMAACAGLPLVEDRKDPRKTTTYGVGQLILAAAAKGV